MKIREIAPEQIESVIFPIMRSTFAQNFSYNVLDVRTPKELEGYDILKTNFNMREWINLGAFDENENLMGFSLSYQARIYELYTQTSIVLPEFRRKGIYTALTKQILEIAKKKGYQMVTSNHVNSNNTVIMAKLKLGYKISGFEISDDFGSMVKLTHYVNEKRAKMFDVRTGYVRPDDEMKSLLKL